MGCFNSKYDRRRSTYFGRRNTLVSRPHISINAGAYIKVEKTDALRKLVFIFGGPGSGKGTIVNNLVEMYNFHFICVEDLILNEVCEMCEFENSERTNAISQFHRFLQENPDRLTLKRIFQLVTAEIEKIPMEDVILIDMVPNLKFLLRSKIFAASRSNFDDDELKLFDEKYPVTLAIDLALDKDHLISNIAQTHACALSPENVKKLQEVDQSDEIDTSRTERRFNIYLNSVEEYVKYFDANRRLLTVDTSSGDIEAVWHAIRDYVGEVKLALPACGIEQVVLFKIDECDFEDVDRDRYPMYETSHQALTPDEKKTSPEALFKELVNLMRSEAIVSKTFLVDIQGSSLLDITNLEKFGKKQLMFLEVEVGTLDFYVHGLRRKTGRKKSLARKLAQVYKTVTTSDNDALIFPISTDSDLCRKLANCYLNAK